MIRKLITLNDIAIIIVLYGKKLDDSLTFQSMINSLNSGADEQVDVILYDNSPTSQQIANHNYIHILDYTHNPSNPGISQAYNESASLAQKHGKKWLIFFDQDTVISKNAINFYLDAINVHADISLFSPILKSQNLIVSPAVFKRRKGAAPKVINAGINSLKTLSPLNSGIAIALEIFFKIGGYNEKVPLDYSDFAFIDRFKKYDDKFFVLDLKFKHGLSSYEHVSFESSIFRYESLCIGLVNSSEIWLNLFFSFIVALKRALRLSFQYKALVYFKILYGTFFNKK